MGFSSLAGFLIAGAVIFFGVFASDSGSVFLDYHAAVIVIGGTLAAALVSFPASTLFNLFKIFIKRLFVAKGQKQNQIISEVLFLLKGYRGNDDFLKNESRRIKDPFLREAVEIINQGGIELDKVLAILHQRASTHTKRYHEEAKAFKSIAKFPPAFGLMGAVIGLIALMQGIGSEDAFATIGPAMAVAMVATFYGIGISNFFFLPIAENLTLVAKDDANCRKIVVEGIRFIALKEHPIYVNEVLLSFLLPSERQQGKRAA